jgi:hypothetical protein
VKRSFRIIILHDAGYGMSFSELDFQKWTKLGLAFRGVHAGHHFFQASILGILNYWEQEWTGCLDKLAKSVTFRVTCFILVLIAGLLVDLATDVRHSRY